MSLSMTQSARIPNHHFAVTPSDVTDFTAAQGTVVSLYIGVAGDVAVVLDGDSVVYTAVPVGGILTGLFSRVDSTNTTATNITAQSLKLQV